MKQNASPDANTSIVDVNLQTFGRQGSATAERSCSLNSMEAAQNSEDDSTNISQISGFEHLSLGCVKELDTKRKHEGPCDITLVVSDAGKEFKAHRDVLAEASPFFERLFNSDMKERNEEVIQIGIVSESVMRDVLQFVYTRSVEILTPQHAEELIVAADYLALSNLKNFAGRFLVKTVCVSNCISHLDFAENYNCEDLVDFTKNFIHANFSAVAECEEFLNITSQEVEKWISSDEINVSTEEEVFEIICRWIKHNKEERSPQFNELFSHVRLFDISREYLSKKIMEESLVKNYKECLTSVTSAISWLDRTREEPVDLPTTQSTRKSIGEKPVIVIAGRTIVCYRPDTDTWYELPECPSKPGTREILASRGDKVDKLDSKSLFLSFEQYDPLLNRWSSLTMPRIPERRDELMSVTVTGENTYAVTILCDVWKYSKKSGSWEVIRCPSRQYLPCVVCEDKFVYFMGGKSSYYLETTETTRVDTVEKKKETLAPMQIPRVEAIGVAAHGKIFVFGGVNDSSCEVYSKETNQWQIIASCLSCYMPYNSLYSGPSTCALSHGTKLYLVGKQGLWRFPKRGDKITPGFECYDIERNTWTGIPIPVCARFDSLHSSLSACSVRIPQRTINSLRTLKIDNEIMNI